MWFSISTKVLQSFSKEYRAAAAWRHCMTWKRPLELAKCKCRGRGRSCWKTSPTRWVWSHFFHTEGSNRHMGFQYWANCGHVVSLKQNNISSYRSYFHYVIPSKMGYYVKMYYFNQLVFIDKCIILRFYSRLPAEMENWHYDIVTNSRWWNFWVNVLLQEV